MFSRLLSLVLPLAFAAGTVHAQDSLGIQGLQASLSYGSADGGQSVTSGLVKLDVNITQVHGLQLDFGLTDGGTALTGQLGAHLYMRPQHNQKYGFFAAVSDMDGEAVQYLNAGIEGRVGVSEHLAVDMHLGIGGTTAMGGTSADQWDYVFAGGGAIYALNRNTTLEARIDLAEFDELTFSRDRDRQHVAHFPPIEHVQLYSVRRSAPQYPTWY